MMSEVVRDIVTQRDEREDWIHERKLRAAVKRELNIIRRAEYLRRKKEASEYLRKNFIQMMYWHMGCRNHPEGQEPKTLEERFGEYTVAMGYRKSGVRSNDGKRMLVSVCFAIRTKGDFFSRPQARMYIADRFRNEDRTWNFNVWVPVQIIQNAAFEDEEKYIKAYFLNTVVRQPIVWTKLSRQFRKFIRDIYLTEGNVT